MEKVAFNKIGKDKCTGCFACFNSCNFNAIEMDLSEDGFFIPKIDTNKCRNCGVCYKKCPVIEESKTNNKLLEAYAAWNTNDSVRLNSSSGGVFSAIAKYVLDELEGIVYGATYENGMVKHIRVEDTEGLQMLRKSKYLPSYVGVSYKEIIKDLKNDKYVLFVGTPCQVDALNKLVNSKEKLITCDLVCHGVPSYLAYESYLKSINMNLKDVEVDFRNKTDGWKNFKVIIKDTKNNTQVSTHHIENKFFKGFVDNMYLKKSCYDCKFSKLPRVGDITLGDFWGVKQEYYSDLGVSIILANNKKGLGIINELTERNKIVIKQVEKEELGENKRIYNGVYKIPKCREELVNFLNNKDFNKFYKKYIYTSYYRKISRKLKRVLNI